MKRGKSIGLLLVGALTFHLATAQESEVALARVLYEFTHINDTLQPDKPHKEEMVLYIGQHASRYATFVNERINEQIKQQMDDPAFDGNLTITGSGRTTSESYYAKVAEQVFKELRSVAGSRYLIDDDYPQIDWEIADETKAIGGYTAQKATGRFKGRDYTAWFTVDLPFQAGPWKLLGLPGLVLEATDSREEVVFHYVGFETLEEGGATVSTPENAIATDRKALDKLVEAFQKNPQAAFSARSAAGSSVAGGSSISVSGGEAMGGIDPNRIKSISVKRDTSQVSSETNNPMELED